MPKKITAPAESGLTWDQTLRFRLLEIVLQWEGRLTPLTLKKGY